MMGYEYKYKVKHAAFADIPDGCVFGHNGKIYKKLSTQESSTAYYPLDINAVEIGKGEQFSPYDAVEVLGGYEITVTDD